MSQTIADYVASLRLSPDLASLKKADRFFGILESKVARHSKKINQTGNLLGVGNTVKGVKALEKAETERIKKSIKGQDAVANAHVKAYQKEFKALERKAHFENKERNAQINHFKKLAIAEKKLATERNRAALRAERAVKYYTPPAPKQVKSKPSAASLMNSHVQQYRALQNQPKSSPSSASLMNSHIPLFRQNQQVVREQLRQDKALAQQIRAENRKQLAMDKMHGQALYMNRMYDARRNQPQRPINNGRPVGVGVMGGGLGGLATAGVAGFGLSALNKVSQRLEMLPISMEAVAGSAEEAAKQLKFLEELGARVGATRLELVPEYTKFFASTKGTSAEKSSQMIFENLTSYGKVMGLDQEAMKGSFRAVTQMVSKQQIMAEELKGQLTR